ncbi:MAG: transposase [Sphingomonadaceae bacterium]
MLSDAEGNPLVVRTTPANIPDQAELPALMEARPAVQGPRGRPRRNPQAIIGDRAYGTKEMIALVRSQRIESLLAPRADDTHGSGLGVLRYVIERTLACLSHFRRLRLCYERRGEHFQAFHELAAALLVCTRLKSLRLSGLLNNPASVLIAV